jgi:hypothetical protein
MTLHLIAHKVRGEPAFDIAEQIECPVCAGVGKAITNGWSETFHCAECDGHGFWWIIPTSGHRAYPWQHWYLQNLGATSDIGFDPDLADPMPEGIRDHYEVSTATPQREYTNRAPSKSTVPNLEDI